MGINHSWLRDDLQHQFRRLAPWYTYKLQGTDFKLDPVAAVDWIPEFPPSTQAALFDRNKLPLDVASGVTALLAFIWATIRAQEGRVGVTNIVFERGERSCIHTEPKDIHITVEFASQRRPLVLNMEYLGPRCLQPDCPCYLQPARTET